MRFFIGDRHEPAEYPDTATELRNKIIMDSTNNEGTDPKGKERACAYFKQYFENGGGVEHPLLGNLETFARNRQADWDFILHGVNSVVATIEKGLATNDPGRRP